MRDLGFHGVPFKSNVFLQPTTHCLVHLSEPPFLVLTLEDLELAALERVIHGTKSFDITFVFKNLHRPVVRVSTVPMAQLEDIKDWLDECNVPFAELTSNITWPATLREVNKDALGFYRDGGWAKLRADDEDESSDEGEDGDGGEKQAGDDGDEGDSEESESEFEASESESGSESDSEDEEDDEDASAEVSSPEDEDESGTVRDGENNRGIITGGNKRERGHQRSQEGYNNSCSAIC